MSSCSDLDLRVPVSPGELLDKMTILAIKRSRLTDPAQLANVSREYAELERVWLAAGPAVAVHQRQIERLRAELLDINSALWDIEDRLRHCESEESFGAEFVALARSVYVTNDRRAAVKRAINLLLRSAIIEEKSYGR